MSLRSATARAVIPPRGAARASKWNESASRTMRSTRQRCATRVVKSSRDDDGRPTKAAEALAEKFTTGGGGADGFCDYDDIKEAIKECEGLEGARLEACYAEYGCNVGAITDHYAKAAGIEDQEKTKK